MQKTTALHKFMIVPQLHDGCDFSPRSVFCLQSPDAVLSNKSWWKHYLTLEAASSNEKLELSADCEAEEKCLDQDECFPTLNEG